MTISESTMMFKFVVLSVVLGVVFSADEPLRTFPKGFKFGAGSSAYQVEGGWDADGKGPNNWDYSTHNDPALTLGGNGDVACDSYHKYQEDINNLAYLGANMYKMSISWSRILPQGTVNNISQAGIDYYNKLIDGLLAAGVEPFVVLFHWDWPLPIYNNGGFNNPDNSRFFEEYADLAFSLFGDRVKNWITFNEPRTFCAGINELVGLEVQPLPLGFVEYDCAHNILVSHANVYHLYNKKYRRCQKGRISIALDSNYAIPATNSTEDIAAAERQMQFDIGWFAHPIFKGDYPSVMKTTILERSKAQGFKTSRLRSFTPMELMKIKGSADFLCFNHYTANLAAANFTISTTPIRALDIGVLTFKNPVWVKSQEAGMTVNPLGFRKILSWLKTNYGDIEIVVTENGYAGNDTVRISFLQWYLNALLDAIYVDKVNVTGYTYWSLMDDFEWTSGYTAQFGLYQVDFQDPNRTRTPKPSVEIYKNIIAANSVATTDYHIYTD